MPKLYIDAFAERNLGQKRELNEDNCFVVPASNPSSSQAGILSVLGVADGMGGHDAGDIASNIACNMLDHLFAKGGYVKFAQQHGIQPNDYHNLIREAYHEINRKVLERANAFKAVRSMGTTCVCGVMWYSEQDDKTYMTFGNVGDSRCYIIRGNDIILATQDDSYVWQLYKKGELSYTEMRTHPKRNVITQAMGINEIITPQVNRIEILAGDTVLFCSDGLHGMVLDTEINKIVKEAPNSRDAAERLIGAANLAGGKDNISVAVAYCSVTPLESVRKAAEKPVVEKTIKHRAVLTSVWIIALLLASIAAFLQFRPVDKEEKFSFEVVDKTVTIEVGSAYSVKINEKINSADTLESLIRKRRLNAFFSKTNTTEEVEIPNLKILGSTIEFNKINLYNDNVGRDTVCIKFKKQVPGETKPQIVGDVKFVLIVNKKKIVIPDSPKVLVEPSIESQIVVKEKNGKIRVIVPPDVQKVKGALKSISGEGYQPTKVRQSVGANNLYNYNTGMPWPEKRIKITLNFEREKPVNKVIGQSSVPTKHQSNENRKASGKKRGK